MKKAIIFLTLLSVLGCELVVDVDMPVQPQQLVLSSLFNPDSTWVAKVTLNRHILDNAPTMPVANAEVIVYEGSVPVDTLISQGDGYYQSNHLKPTIGKEYSISASSNNYESVRSSSSIPPSVIPTMSAVEEGASENGQREYFYSMKFTDPPGNNFYQVVAIAEYRYTNSYTGQGVLNRVPVHVWSDDKGIDDEDIPNHGGFLFPDVLFNEKEFTLNVKMTGSWWSGNEGLKYMIYFRTVSEDYYKYKSTSLLQDYTSGDPFAQPVKVYNNIENGYGIFAGFSQCVFIIQK